VLAECCWDHAEEGSIASGGRMNYSPPHRNTYVPPGTCADQQITTLSRHTSFLPRYLAQSVRLAADRQGQWDTRLTLTPSVIPNRNYVIMARV
jgi:hypothetical protein